MRNIDFEKHITNVQNNLSVPANEYAFKLKVKYFNKVFQNNINLSFSQN